MSWDVIGQERAVALLRRALDEYQVVGVKTTIPFHRRLMENEDFCNGDIYTHFLEERFDLEARPEPQDETALLAAALLSHHRRHNGASPAAAPSSANSDGWRRAARIASLRSDSDERRGGASWRSTS